MASASFPPYKEPPRKGYIKCSNLLREQQENKVENQKKVIEI